MIRIAFVIVVLLSLSSGCSAPVAPSPTVVRTPTVLHTGAAPTATPPSTRVAPATVTSPAHSPGVSSADLEGFTAAVVVRTVDGDTAVVEIDGQEHRLRYIGVDTPETVHPTRGEQPFGKAASDRNRELVEGRTVYLEKDVSETDQFGRLLRYVWLDENTLVNAVLVWEGLAQVITVPPDVKRIEELLPLQREAAAAGRGLWGQTDALAIVSLTSPVQAGSTATLQAKTAPGAACSLSYRTPAGSDSRARGLGEASADSEGGVKWTWAVGATTEPGTGTVTVTCGDETANAPITVTART